MASEINEMFSSAQDNTHHIRSEFFRKAPNDFEQVWLYFREALLEEAETAANVEIKLRCIAEAIEQNIANPLLIDRLRLAEAARIKAFRAILKSLEGFYGIAIDFKLRAGDPRQGNLFGDGEEPSDLSQAGGPEGRAEVECGGDVYTIAEARHEKRT